MTAMMAFCNLNYYEGCEHLAGFFNIAPEAKARLDSLRAGDSHA